MVLRDTSAGNYRYFVKQDLRRIRYANPKTAIEISKFPKTEADTWQSSLLMEFGGPSLVFSLVSLGTEQLFFSRGRVEEVIFNGR